MSTARISLDPINTEDEDSSAENSSNTTCNHDVSCCLWQKDCDEKTCNELSCKEYCTKDRKCSPFTTLPANIQEINMTTKCCECNYCDGTDGIYKSGKSYDYLHSLKKLLIILGR